MIAQMASQKRWRRIFLIVGAIIAAYALLAPLTSLDFAQSANVPLLASRSWLRIATYIVMFIAMATAWNIIGGITGYAAFGNVAFFGIGAYTSALVTVGFDVDIFGHTFAKLAWLLDGWDPVAEIWFGCRSMEVGPRAEALRQREPAIVGQLAARLVSDRSDDPA